MQMCSNSDTPDHEQRRARQRLFIVGLLVLFLELACIRWFAAYVIFLQFFTNIVLIACFLGTSIGCLCAARKTNWLALFPRITFWSACAAVGVCTLYGYWSGLAIDVGGQNAPEVIFFGTEYRAVDLAKFVVPIEVLAAVFFVLITLMFVGLGQVLGRAFDACPDRVTAYMINIAGSLVGIVAFAVLAIVGMPPAVWFLVGFIGVAWLLRQNGKLCVAHVFYLAAAVLVIVIADYPLNRDIQTRWSPYYQITYQPKNKLISANTIGYQQMVSWKEPGAAYSLVHLLQRDSGGAPFKEALVIGAGSGNDLAHCLLHGVEHVDAVEIDPMIQSLGARHHPDRPYDDPRVSVLLNDGRNVLRSANRKYDLVAYALVDSLILHSSYSSIRLESFLFTEEAFQDVKNVMKPGGVFVMYNYFRQGWVIQRLSSMLEKVFDQKPLVVSLPYVREIHSNDSQAGQLTVFLVGNTDAIASRFAEHKAFHLHREVTNNMDVNGFEETSRGHDWLKIAPARVMPTKLPLAPATDDWPFLYLRSPMLPRLYMRAIAVIGGLALIMLWLFSPGRRLSFHGRMFFLGAGFLLLETKAVVHLALVFGSTWLVNSLVFFFILLMTLGSNLYVIRRRKVDLRLHYVALFACLALNCLVPLNVFLGGGFLWKYAAPSILTMLPIFFAGVIFAATFRESKDPGRDFGSNIAGAVVGGLTEYCTTLLGFRHLLIVAILYYALSTFRKKRAGTIT